ncbi:MAG: RidA family protein [Clostridiales Family XIII bacterium]|jgi:2-iminobutanoate/2-iminopropanoate deaminase|nr:RidA family protein [Clostridiales Family XIII bacterium]
MKRSIVSTSKAPAAIGPYAQANKIGNLIFTSGQIPLDPTTGAPVGDSVEAQTARVLENLRAILEEAGSGLDKVVKTTVFLRDMNDFARMNETYASFFPGPMLPSRSAVEVARLPKDALVEIEAVAAAGDASDL